MGWIPCIMDKRLPSWLQLVFSSKSFCGIRFLLFYHCVSGLYLDARAALNYVFQRTDLNLEKVFIFGRSLGGAVAIHIASQANYSGRLAGVIVENTFTSLPDIGRHLFSFRIIKYLPMWCHKNKVGRQSTLLKPLRNEEFLALCSPSLLMINVKEYSVGMDKNLL